MKDDNKQNNPINAFREFQKSLISSTNYFAELKKSLDVTAVNYKKIGRASPAHILAWTLHRKKRPEVKKVTEAEVLRWLAMV